LPIAQFFGRIATVQLNLSSLASYVYCTKYGTRQRKHRSNDVPQKKRLGSNHQTCVYCGPVRCSAVAKAIAMNTLSYRPRFSAISCAFVTLYSVCVRHSSAPTTLLTCIPHCPFRTCSGWRCDCIHGGQRLEARRSGSDSVRYGESLKAVHIRRKSLQLPRARATEAGGRTLARQGWTCWKHDQSWKFRGIRQQ